MRARELAGAVAVVVGLAPVLTGCGADDERADDVPTITTRPSTPAESSSAAPTTSSAPTSTSPSETTSAPSAPASSSADRPTGSPTSTPDAAKGPTTYAEAESRIDQVAATAPAPVAATRFATARDVVYCLLDDDVIGPSCELRTGFIQEESYCGGGATNGVGRIETLDGRAEPVCNTDTIREPGARVVAAPGVVRMTGGGVECVVESFGVTCVDTRARTGFFLGPGEFHVF